MTKLIWLTDLHLVDPEQDWPAGVDPLAHLRACLKEIEALHADADRIIISGDLIQLNNTRAYEVLRREIEPLRLPYRLLAGNHDDRDALLSFFPEVDRNDGFVQYAEEIAGARILYLDTLASDGKHHGELCPTRVEWIAGQFEAVGDAPLLIFLHHPPCSIGVPALDRLKLQDTAPLADLLRMRRGLTHLFCGHVHRNVSGLWAGHPFAALKSTHVQFDLDMTGDKLVRSTEPPGFAVIHFANEQITVNYRDIPTGTVSRHST
ncbi:phosphodiesterase [Nitratireductor rhodophyticola]|uniref:phosphodiesterase n=1 Tax=Nitratireductor rhodophyticola TaxID=2854036 RepID=UPI002AC9DAB0|nr:phosphodiesterase [Nitratireductor rhodophyticola]MEC9244210.1 phosphodiesterase [Pseudomonadota bacterium]WPZ15151.1 phosphodiesterase [Nitratireductor rhodophyticola]